jgi:hypothetical protein
LGMARAEAISASVQVGGTVPPLNLNKAADLLVMRPGGTVAAVVDSYTSAARPVPIRPL